MASAPRPSASSRSTWRDRSRAREKAVDSKRARRWLLSLLLLLLIGLLLWEVWQTFFSARATIAQLSVVDYDALTVPPAPFVWHDSEAFLEAGLPNNRLEGYQTGESVKNLRTKLDAAVPRAKDTLVLYVAAHGVSLDDKGELKGYLLSGNFDFFNDNSRPGSNDLGRIEINEFLKQVRECRAGDKIILLDAGHLSVEPRLGMLVNEFPRLLADAVRDTGDESLWVLSANSMHETSHVSYKEHQSLFNHFVVAGLAGKANTNPPNNWIDLAELTSFVGKGVADWTKGQASETQTPQLLWGGEKKAPVTTQAAREALVQRMQRVRIPLPPPKAEPAPDASPAVPAKTAPAKTTRRASPIRSLGMGLALAQAPPAATPAAPGPASNASPTVPVPASAPPAAAAPTVPVPTSPTPTSASPTNPGAAPAGAAPVSPALDPNAKAAPTAAPASPESAGPFKKDRESLRKAWETRDAKLARSGEFGWSPIDFAPHLSRKYDRRILAEEFRLRAREGAREEPVAGAEPPPAGNPEAKLAAKPSENLGNVLKSIEDDTFPDLKRLEAAFLSSETARNLQLAAAAPLRQALQLRNDYIYHGLDLVTWHAVASRGAQNKNDQYDSLIEFLTRLTAFNTLLTELAAAPFTPELQRKLDEQRQPLTQVYNRLIAATEWDDAVLPRDLSDATRSRQVKDLLATPLLAAAARAKLWAALDQSGNAFRDPAADPNDRDGLERLLAAWDDKSKSLNASEDPWLRAQEQAQLEALVVQLADPIVAAELAKSASGPKPRKSVSVFGRELAAFYRKLPADITQAAAGKDAPSLARAERELRLLLAGQAAEDDLITRVVWSTRITPAFEFVATNTPEPIMIEAGTARKVELALQSLDGFAGDVQIELEFDPALLRVEDANRVPVVPGRLSELRAMSSAASLPLVYWVRAAKPLPGIEARLGVVAKTDSRPDEPLTIRFAVPRDQGIDLKVTPAGDLREANMVQELGPDRVQLATFPGHQTSFLFQLRQQAGVPRDVSVELYGVKTADREQRRLLETAVAKGAKRAELLQAGAQLLATAEPPDPAVPPAPDAKKPLPGMKLPKTDEWTPIAFKSALPPPAPPVAPAAAPGAAPPPPAIPAEAPLPKIDGGLLLVVNDLDPAAKLAPWVTWVDIAPWPPKDYLDPKVNYDLTREELTIDLAPLGAALPQDGKPIAVNLEVLDDIPQDKIVRGTAKLTARRPSDQLKIERIKAEQIKAAPASQGGSVPTVELRLNVDGYPRAFIYKVPLGSDQRSVERERVLRRIRVIKPDPNRVASYHAPGDLDDPARKVEIPIELQVDVPDVSFLAGESDQIEVGIDEDGTRTLGQEMVMESFPVARSVDLGFAPVSADGVVTIKTEVSDLKKVLLHEPANYQRQFFARLVLGGKVDEASKQFIDIKLDDAPPKIENVTPVQRAFKGKPVVFKVTASDGISGVKSISWVLDENGNGEVDAAEFKKAVPLEASSEESGLFTIEWKTDEVPIGTHTLLFWATDKVDWDSKDKPYPRKIEIEREPPKPAPPDPNKMARPKLGTITGKVIYGGGVSSVKVTLSGPTSKEPATTDSSGTFLFKDLNPGEYTLETKATVKNTLVEGSAKATVPPMPQGPVTQDIKLEKLDNRDKK